MLLMWHYYWPALAVALVVGIVTGFIAYGPTRVRVSASEEERQEAVRKRRRLGRRVLVGGGLAVFALTALWHGPIGAAGRFTKSVENTARYTLDYYEMTQVEAGLKSGPLNRTLMLSGPADDFQRSELIRIFLGAPGVEEVQWQDSGQGGSYPFPLLADVEFWSLVAFALGLLLAYLIELRRRSQRHWRW